MKKRKQARKRLKRAPKGPGAHRKPGRVHLRVIRDTAGRPQSLALSGPLLPEAWQDRLAVATASTVSVKWSSELSAASVSAATSQVLDAASQAAERALAGSATEPPACRAGCDHCCHQSVGVTAPEALLIAEHLREHLSEQELVALGRRVAEADAKTAGLSPGERHSPELPCPLLIDHQCSIYEVRPLVCRGTNSLDADACRRVLTDPGARTSGPGGASPVPRYLQLLGVGHAMSAGLQLAGSQLFGLKMEPLELRTALRVAFEDPEGVTARWLAGGEPFAAARVHASAATP